MVPCRYCLVVNPVHALRGHLGPDAPPLHLVPVFSPFLSWVIDGGYLVVNSRHPPHPLTHFLPGPRIYCIRGVMSSLMVRVAFVVVAVCV